MKERFKTFFDVKFWKFLLVGVLNTIVGTGLNFVFLNLVFNFLNTDVNFWVSSGVSYILASFMSYFLNKYFTFKNTEKGWQPILKFWINIGVCYFLAYFLAQNAVNWLITIEPFKTWATGIFNNEFFTNLFKTYDNFTVNAATLVAMCFFTLFNYVGQRFFAFKAKGTQTKNK
ncbi:MAG: GtrA family protein [Oscillospiraceae bacterium]|jgi:putative flippase GtrA|nr:GtrA family protein [Oscillospiraceae bacterium]